jgi:hypothetical protein
MEVEVRAAVGPREDCAAQAITLGQSLDGTAPARPAPPAPPATPTARPLPPGPPRAVLRACAEDSPLPDPRAAAKTVTVPAGAGEACGEREPAGSITLRAVQWSGAPSPAALPGVPASTSRHSHARQIDREHKTQAGQAVQHRAPGLRGRVRFLDPAGDLPVEPEAELTEDRGGCQRCRGRCAVGAHGPFRQPAPLLRARKVGVKERPVRHLSGCSRAHTGDWWLQPA